MEHTDKPIISGKWNYYICNINEKIINNLIIQNTLNNFKEEIISKLRDNQKVLMQFKIGIKDNPVSDSLSNFSLVRNISTVDTITKKSFHLIYDIYQEYWNLKLDEYNSMFDSININEENLSIIYSYNIVPSSINLKISEPKKLNSNKSIPFLNFKGYSLPNTMDFTTWGQYFFEENYTKATVFKSNSKAVYKILVKERKLLVDYIINDKIIFKFEDLLEDKFNLDCFTRNIYLKNNKFTYKFIDGKIVLILKDIKSKYISKLRLDEYYKNNFVTLDLETQVINNKIIPYCLSTFDGKKKSSFYLSDYNNKDEMLKSGIKSIFKRKNNGSSVFVHNFSNFDVILLLNTLSTLSFDNKISLIINNNNFISLKLDFTEKYKINFKDSYLLLPSSLKKLSKYFNTDIKKYIFPYNFLKNRNVSLNYVGEVPSIKYFNNITLEEYETYCKEFNKNWSLKEETKKYCEQDVVALHSVLDKFNLLIYDLIRINAIKYPTLSSLAFAIYRATFLEAKIPKLTGDVYNFIHKGYYGGAVDVYKPKLTKGLIYKYDVNSLYPYVMSKFDMPVGNAKYFEGDIFLIEKDPFGFFEVEVESPKFLNHPILLHKSVNKKFNNRTIASLGNWKNVYFSEEIKNAKKYGYKFKVLKGYLFERKNIFDKFVSTFYSIKKNSDKKDPMYMISKLILNSLYGKFGMSPYKNKHVILDKNEIYSFIDKSKIKSVIELDNDKVFMEYEDNQNFNLDNNYIEPNINIAIAAAITAYARIHMSQFKNNKNIELYYSDTDSIDVTTPLNSNIINEELGSMKLENIFKRAVYLAPKVYGGININNESVIKIKGSKVKLSYDQLEVLLNKDNKLTLDQEKWYKNISDSSINIRNDIYTLMVTTNKRELIYDEKNRLVDTKPFILNEIN